MTLKKGWELPTIIVACLTAYASMFVVTLLGLGDKTGAIETLMAVTLAAVLCVFVCVALKNPNLDRLELLIFMVVIMGIVMRIGYMLYTSLPLRQHDIGGIDPRTGGHAGYIALLLGGNFPEYNAGQYYHPPFEHLLSAAAVWLYELLSGAKDLNSSIAMAKTVSCCASIAMLFVIRGICREVDLSKKAQLLVMTLMAFYPTFYLFAGYVNNDPVSLLFICAIIYFTLRWYRTRTWSGIIILALCFGLGMMTKMSVAVYSLVTGLIMLIALFKAIKQKKAGGLIGRYAVFGAIAFPLGLWYPLWNYLRFGQKLNYVMPTPLTSPLYCGDATLWQRLGVLFPQRLYVDVVEDSNIWAYIARSSVFGEYSFDIPKLIPVMLLAVNIILIIASLAAMVYVLLRHRNFGYLALAGYWAVQLASYVSFNFEYPFTCTMDFRYIVPTAIIGAIFLAKAWDSLSAKSGRGGALIKYSVPSVVALFSVLSVTMFCII